MTARPVVAMIDNSLTPYRVHQHRRIVRELPAITLHTLLTHDESNSPWTIAPPPELRVVRFGVGQPSTGQARPRYAVREWRKGGEITHWLRDHAAKAVVLGGYNDPGRLRVVRWCRANGVPCFLFGDSNVRGDNATGWKRRVKRVVVGNVLKQCTGAMCCGTLGRDYFVRYGVPPERVYFMPYEPDYDAIGSVTADEVAATAKRFGLADGRRRIVYSGRLVADKRVDLLLNAFASVAAERPEWDVVLLGDGPLRDELKAGVPPSLAGRVRWLGFVDDQATVSAVYRACDLLALPSDFEPWAVVVNEALAAGLAVVASDAVGAAADLVRDGVNGRLFPRGNLAALTRALRDATCRCDVLRSAAARVLADWREVADPVDGLRQALRSAGVLP